MTLSLWLLALLGLALLLALMYGRRSGSEARHKNTLKAIKKARKVENEVKGMSDTDIVKRVSKWFR